MFDLGKYSDAILISWGVSLALIGLLIWQSLWASRRARRDLEAAEERRKTNG